MTDRDTFAAAALTGWLASQQTVISQTEMAMRAYDYADAMLRVRAMRSSMECVCPTRDGYRIQSRDCPLHGSPASTRATGVSHAQAWSCDLNRYVTADEEQRMANHDAVPEATATTTPLNKGAACKTATSGTGNTPTLSESEREAIEQMLDEASGKACSESWVPEILRNLLERLK